VTGIRLLGLSLGLLAIDLLFLVLINAANSTGLDIMGARQESLAFVYLIAISLSMTLACFVSAIFNKLLELVIAYFDNRALTELENKYGKK
jgi:predicted membrane-bound spermidine synthase